ncbi:serine/threonine protein kinase [Parafrankia colletiae]|uniref:Serine/threonine protein kinase n=1 Tax=Parafrankia colletiae TaxID=573497 RepID=A0A1S1QN97_9ACTN|nr:protein kinase [Parafrankia colletiae]MCK9900448.1 serine/threonine-protein kinase [Frankia sp. Cpl3]OHV33814.1 serine/threonine protein kinase [Parafrankia colletiae]
MSSEAGIPARTVPLGADDPRELGSYQLLGKLGQGGMGTVYLGRSQQGRLVAIKVIRADVADNPEFRARFWSEAETARRVARVCTAEVLEAAPHAPQPYLVTEFIEGETLARFVARNGPLADANLEQLAVGVAAALTAIHRAGIVHRDLKPANVVLSPFGPRVIDFGIARALDSASGLTGDLQQLGTPAFMSPEQIEGGAVTPAVDIWAWGGLVTYAATGHYPFGEGNAQVLLYRALNEEPRLDGVDTALRPIVWHAMRKNPAGRPTAQQLMLRLLGDPTDDVDATIDPSEVTNVLQGWNLPIAPGTGPGLHAAGPGGGQTGSAGGGPGADDRTVATIAATRGPGAATGAGPGTGPSSGGTGGGGTPERTRVDEGSHRNRRGPVVIGAAAAVAAVVIAATLIALGGGGDDDAASGSDAPASLPPGALPQSAAPLDDTTMVFASDQNGNYDLFTGRLPDQGELTDIRPITTTAEDDLLPSVSADRRTVVFTRREGAENALYAVAADGSGAPIRLFTSGPASKLTIADDARPSLSPDGKFLVVRSTTSVEGLPDAGLYVASLDGVTVFRLNAKPQATDPAWSPSGELIAYWSSDTESDRGFIVTIPVRRDSTPTPVTAGDGNRDADPTFSPDGQRIAFSREVEGDLEIFQMNTDGSGLTRVTAEPGRDQDPAYSPDGSRLVFTGERGTPVRRLYLTDPANTTDADRLLTNIPSFHVRWSNG